MRAASGVDKSRCVSLRVLSSYQDQYPESCCIWHEIEKHYSTIKENMNNSTSISLHTQTKATTTFHSLGWFTHWEDSDIPGYLYQVIYLFTPLRISPYFSPASFLHLNPSQTWHNGLPWWQDTAETKPKSEERFTSACSLFICSVPFVSEILRARWSKFLKRCEESSPNVSWVSL